MLFGILRAQVSIISQRWLKQCLLGCDSWDIAELLGMDGLEWNCPAL